MLWAWSYVLVKVSVKLLEWIFETLPLGLTETLPLGLTANAGKKYFRSQSFGEHDGFTKSVTWQ